MKHLHCGNEGTQGNSVFAFLFSGYPYLKDLTASSRLRTRSNWPLENN